MGLGRRKEEAALKGGSLVTSVLPEKGIQEPSSTLVYAKSASTTPTSVKRGRVSAAEVKQCLGEAGQGNIRCSTTGMCMAGNDKL